MYVLSIVNQERYNKNVDNKKCLVRSTHTVLNPSLYAFIVRLNRCPRSFTNFDDISN